MSNQSRRYRRCVHCEWVEDSLSESLYEHVRRLHKPHSLDYYPATAKARGSSWRLGKSPGSTRSGWY